MVRRERFESPISSPVAIPQGTTLELSTSAVNFKSKIKGDRISQVVFGLWAIRRAQ